MFVESANLDLVLRGALLTVLGMIWVVLLVRFVGLRSFSKMTNFDFVMTVAMGSLLAGASQSTKWGDFAQIIVAMTALFFVQWLIARIRKSSNRYENFIQNEPIILMRDGEFLDEALDNARVAKDDIIAKLREANVLELNQVRAVVLETTGDVSVLHGKFLEDVLLTGVEVD